MLHAASCAQAMFTPDLWVPACIPCCPHSHRAESLSCISRTLKWETLKDCDLGRGRVTAFPYPVCPCDAKGGEGVTLQGPGDCSLWTPLQPGPTLMPALGTPPTSLLVFLLQICRFSPCILPTSFPASSAMHINVIWVFWQFKGLRIILNICFQLELLCSGRLWG